MDSLLSDISSLVFIAANQILVPAMPTANGNIYGQQAARVSPGRLWGNLHGSGWKPGSITLVSTCLNLMCLLPGSFIAKEGSGWVPLLRPLIWPDTVNHTATWTYKHAVFEIRAVFSLYANVAHRAGSCAKRHFSDELLHKSGGGIFMLLMTRCNFFPGGQWPPKPNLNWISP